VSEEQHGPAALDERFDSLVRQRFDHIVERFPVYATYLGIDGHDHRLADGSSAAIEQDIIDARRFLADVEALDPDGLSPENRTERELAIFTTRRAIFDDEVHRIWERRVSATDELGDGVFLLFARGSRPLAERLTLIASRLEAAPRLIEEHKTRLKGTPMRLWNELEREAAGSLPSLFAEVITAARAELGDDDSDLARLVKASALAERALQEYSAWIRDQLRRTNDDFALGAERYDELIRLRAFDGLGTEDILEIGYQQLNDSLRARRETAAEIDPEASEQQVIEHVKSDHPSDFDGALSAYREAMTAARRYTIEHGLASMPEGESLSVIATPEYLRRVYPFAVYIGPAKFDPHSAGLYVVTPFVDDDPRAIREHNFASIYNTSIHEAYPGHHQQLTTAQAHPSLVRVLIDAPEFVEGWAMYCEQMMREEGFDSGPDRRLMMHRDAIWRACRIILDVRLHRGQTGIDEAIDFLIQHTGFERANATAEVNRYTHTPTYQLSYLLGKILLLRLRAEERVRLGQRFSLKTFHDSLLREGSLPISFQRRLLAAKDGAAT
jgi:uncharacterized protein (DUF885 family)